MPTFSALWAQAKFYAGLAALLIILTLAGLWRFAVRGEHSAQAQAANLKVGLGLANDKVAQIQVAIRDQNAAVVTWQAQAGAQATQAAQAQGRAGTIRSVTEAKAQAAMTQPAPADPARDLDWLLSEVNKSVLPINPKGIPE